MPDNDLNHSKKKGAGLRLSLAEILNNPNEADKTAYLGGSTKKMKISIRIAELKDEEQIIECINSSYEKYVDRIGKKPAPMLADYNPKIQDGCVYVVDQDSIIIGLIILIPKSDYLYLGNLAVHPSMQGKGIGRQLMKYAETLAVSSGFSKIRLFTNEKMYENLIIYKKYGYSETERKTENGYNRVYFIKNLM